MSRLGDMYRATVELMRWRDVRRTFRHISGPGQIRLDPYQVGLVLLGRNNAYFLEDCIRHHTRMGADHVVYVDNGSSDASVDIASSMPNTTVVSCSASFRDSQRHIRHIAVTEYLKGGWRLAIDCDEVFDYPQADELSLHDLVRRLGENDYNGMIAYMLEMVPDRPVADYDETIPFSQVRREFSGYSTEGISGWDYADPKAPLSYFLQQNRVSGAGAAMLFGGIRRLAFGEDCCLIKHPLFKPSFAVEPMVHPHVTTGLRCPDFTGILYHYKFAGGVVQREQKLIEQKRLSHTEAQSRAAIFARDPGFSFHPFISAHDPDANVFVKNGAIRPSRDAERLVPSLALS